MKKTKLIALAIRGQFGSSINADHSSSEDSMASAGTPWNLVSHNNFTLIHNSSHNKWVLILQPKDRNFKYLGILLCKFHANKKRPVANVTTGTIHACKTMQSGERSRTFNGRTSASFTNSVHSV
jgi:hypothetical protein